MCRIEFTCAIFDSDITVECQRNRFSEIFIFSKQLIRERKIEQKTVAEAVGVSEQAISYFVRGLKEPSLAVLGRIAKVLGVSAAELIKE